MNSAADFRVFEFGGFTLNAALRQLTDPGGQVVELPSRAFDLLLYMAERPGEALDKSTLLKAVWPNTVVEEGNLTQTIFALRRAFGDARFITTIPGRGYQFVAQVRRGASSPEVRPAERPEPENRPHASALSPHRKRVFAAVSVVLIGLLGYLFWPRPATSPLRSIAVLPFSDLTPGKDMEYFGDGLAEELMNALGKLHGLQVVGRRSAFTFKNKSEDVRKIGAALNAESVLEGSVRREGDRLRISAQLSRASDGYSLWTETYDRKLDDVLDVQQAIARDVARALNPLFAADQTIASRVRTNNPEAYASYLRGIFFYGKLDIEHARDEFLRATKLDPQFAMAFAQLARCYDVDTYGGRDNTAAFRTQADAALAHALEIDPTLEDVWWIYSLRKGEGMGQGAVTTLLERAVAENSSDADAMLDLARTYALFGRRAESVAMLERAYQADPMWAGTIYALAYFSYSFNGDRKRFLDLTDALARIDPASAGPLYMRSDLALFEGRALDWDEYLSRTIERAPRSSETHAYIAKEYADIALTDAVTYHYDLAVKLSPLNPYVARTLAHVRLYSAGDTSAAKRIVDEVIERQPDDMFALRARAELQYFQRDCEGSLKSLVHSSRSLGLEALDVVGDSVTDWEVVPWLLWCLGQQGNHSRQAEIARTWDIAFRPPSTPDVGVIRARTYAARGDRSGLIEELERLVGGKAAGNPFSRFEPMIQPYLEDPEVARLLATLEARCAEWRKILPKASMRVPIPDAPAKAAGGS